MQNLQGISYKAWIQAKKGKSVKFMEKHISLGNKYHCSIPYEYFGPYVYGLVSYMYTYIGNPYAYMGCLYAYGLSIHVSDRDMHKTFNSSVI